MDIEEQKEINNNTRSYDSTWISRCCKMNKEISKPLLKYIVQINITMILLIYSMIQLNKEDSKSRELYISIISTIIGIYLPSPSHKD
jgi:hypothetical protein